jgi:predicted amidohydrolase YtcJ
MFRGASWQTMANLITATLITLACPFALLTASKGMEGNQPVADALYVSGNIYTLDPARPRAEALAVAGERLLAVGSNAEIRKVAGPATRVHDLAGRTVLPGLIDAHCHFAALGSYSLGHVDLSPARSFDEIIAAVAARTAKTEKGAWILGGRWDHERWPERRLPTNTALSAATPDNPVWLRRVDGHAGIANAAALKLAGITRDTPAPPGGDIIHDEHGELTGVLVDNATELVEKLIPTPADSAALILKAQQLCLAAGLTGVHDAGIPPAEVGVYRKLADQGALKIRVYAMIAGDAAETYFREHGLYFSDRLTVRSAKLYADGALGSRGAWLLAPYSDRPVDQDGRPYVGLNVMPPDVLRRVAADGLKQAYQVCTHAIGDRANREVLDAYAAALAVAPIPASAGKPAGEPPTNHRFRIEHAQVLSPADVPRFAELGVIASMQPTHCTSDMRWVDERIGAERSAGAYAWASILRTGAHLAGGSDFPVESHNPFLGIHAAITRQNAEGDPSAGWHPAERLTREEALRAFTLDAAYAAFEETQKGSLQPGKLADFIVIDRDLMTCEPREIIGTRVLETVIGAETVYGGGE